MLPGHEQKPGQVPADVIDELKAKIRDMPEKKNTPASLWLKKSRRRRTRKKRKIKKRKVEAVSETDTAAALG